MVRHVRVGLHLFNQARYEGLRPPSALLLEEVEVLLEQGVGGLGHLDFSLDLAALDDLLLSASLEGTSIGRRRGDAAQAQGMGAPISAFAHLWALAHSTL